MTGRVNALEAIYTALTENGWVSTHLDKHPESGNPTLLFEKDDRRLSIHFKLYGSQGSERLCRYYGKGEPINWGVANAVLRGPNKEWTGQGEVMQVLHVFEGKNKRGQLIKFAKEG